MSMSPETTVLRGLNAERAPRARVDAELRTSRYLRGAKSDPRLLDPGLERAFDEATEVVLEAARAEGFAAGYANGRTQAAAEVRAELEGELALMREAEANRESRTAVLLTSLGRAVTELEERLVPTYDEAADRLGHAAYLLVEAMLGRELVLSRDLALDAVRRTCATAPRGADLTIWLNPADIETLQGADLISLVGRPVRLLTDSTLAHGDAIAESGATRVDARLATALGRVREVLEG